MAIQNFSELAAFVAVARQRSFRAASVALGVSPSAISHALRLLEERLALRLINRTTRSVALTEAGARLYEQLAPAFDTVTRAVDELNIYREDAVGTVRINAARQAARLVVTPVVAEFVRSHPRMKVEITVDDHLTDVVGEGFDAGVRLGELVAEDMIAIPLGPPVRFAVVATPSYFEQREPPRRPKDLKQHDCVVFRYPGGRLYHWEFERRSTSVQVAVKGSLTFNDMDLVLDAVRMGAGVGYVFEAQAAPLLSTGELVRVLDAWLPARSGFYLYYPSRRHLSYGLNAFLKFIRSKRY